MIFIENLKLSNDSIVFVNKKSTKNKKKPTSKKKKTIKKKTKKNKIFEIEDKKKTKIKSHKKYVGLNDKNLNGDETHKITSAEDDKMIKKTKTGPKKTGWWSQ